MEQILQSYDCKIVVAFFALRNRLQKMFYSPCYFNAENYRVEKHQLREFHQDKSIDNRIVGLIPINATHILQHGQIEIQISREPLGILFSDRIDSRDLKPRSANYIQKLILNNAKKFCQSVQKLSFKDVDPFEYYVYQLISISFPCIWVGLFEGDWTKIFKDEGISHTVDFILNAPNSVLFPGRKPGLYYYYDS